MKLYDAGMAPNPRRVRIFLAEKGIQVPLVPIDLNRLEHRSPEYEAVNPLRRVPALELDDGTVLTESVAICRYFEALRPEPALFGRGAKEEALVEMWQRRLELHLLAPVAAVFRHLHPAMRQMEVPQIPEWGEANKPRVQEFLAVLDSELRDRLFIAGEHYSIADITGLVALGFMKPAKLPLDGELRNVHRWYAHLLERPSARA